MHVLPQQALTGQARLGIIPDARLRLSLPLPRPAAAGPVQGPATAPREYLFDMKTISAGSNWYSAAAAETGVEARARTVLSEYESAARRLDQKHHATSPHNVGPVLSALRAFPPVTGTVFGAYGGSEASKDIHTILVSVPHAAAIIMMMTLLTVGRP